jgi:hypothetical protein
MKNLVALIAILGTCSAMAGKPHHLKKKAAYSIKHDTCQVSDISVNTILTSEETLSVLRSKGYVIDTDSATSIINDARTKYDDKLFEDASKRIGGLGITAKVYSSEIACRLMDDSTSDNTLIASVQKVGMFLGDMILAAEDLARKGLHSKNIGVTDWKTERSGIQIYGDQGLGLGYINPGALDKTKSLNALKSIPNCKIRK